MNNKNEKKIKELELGTDTTSNTQEINSDKETKSTDITINENNQNSFYDGGTNKSVSAWTKDWRGKTLIFFTLLLIILGIAIPSGMAAAGYFNNGKNKVPNFTSEEQELQVKKDIKHMMDIAISNNYDAMIEQGYWDKKTAKNKLEDIENDIDDQIQKEKDSLKNDTYGNTWKDEWTKSLFNKGFDTEEEYRTSLKASKLKDEQVSSYTSTSLYTSKGEFKSTNYEYVSGEDSNKKITYINNDEGILKENNNTVYNGEINIISPEDLTKLYVTYYQPLAFNSSIIELTTIGNDGSQTIAPDLISVTKENLQKLRHLKNSLNNKTLVPQNKIEGSIQSRSNINLSPAANAAIYSYIAAATIENDGGLFNYVVQDENNFYDNEQQINSLTTTELEKEAKNLFTKLHYFQNDGKRSLYFTENAADSNSRKNGDYNNQTYISYLDTDGIHYIGLTAAGETLVTNFLNKKNKTVDNSDISFNEIPDLGFQDSLNSFITKNAETIILLNQIYDFENSKFNDDVIETILADINEETNIKKEFQTTKDNVTSAIPFYINKYNSKQISSAYYGIVDYAKENRTVFNYEEIKKDDELFKAVSNFELYNAINKVKKPNKATKRGDQYE